ncbi:MAG TPA: hypothetical protein VGL97_13660 [Bryobacteraceae bacterium]
MLQDIKQIAALARQRNAKRMRFAFLIALLIAVLLWWTQWLSLRPGLVILLIGQLGSGLILRYRNHKLAAAGRVAPLIWFDDEEAFVKRLSLFENGLRAIGFLVLAFGLWTSTRSLWLAVALGIVYPATAYFGMARRSDARLIEELRRQKKEMQELPGTAEHSENPI